MSANPIVIRALIPADAASLSSCFEKCYGATYPVDAFYDVDRMAQMIEDGQLRSVVAVHPARGEADMIVGHTGLTIRHADALAIEAGNTIVDPEYRGSGLLKRLGAALAELCEQSGYTGYLHYPTTAHEIMQKRSVSGGGVETGIMLAYIPEETEYKFVQRIPGRLAAMVVYQPIRQAPTREVVLPGRYQQLIEELYKESGLSRSVVNTIPLDHAAATFTETFHQRRDLLQFFCVRSRSELIQRAQQAVANRETSVIHTDITLDDPEIDEVVAALTRVGFFYCALLPEFAHTDVLRLQWLREPDEQAFSPQLANPTADRLLTFVRADR